MENYAIIGCAQGRECLRGVENNVTGKEVVKGLKLTWVMSVGVSRETLSCLFPGLRTLSAVVKRSP